MPLNKAGLEQELKAIFEAEGNDAASVAADMATAIDNYVKTATVTTTVAPGILVQVVPATGTGATTGPGSGTGTLS